MVCLSRRSVWICPTWCWCWCSRDWSGARRTCRAAARGVKKGRARRCRSRTWSTRRTCSCSSATWWPTSRITTTVWTGWRASNRNVRTPISKAPKWSGKRLKCLTGTCSVLQDSSDETGMDFLMKIHYSPAPLVNLGLTDSNTKFSVYFFFSIVRFRSGIVQKTRFRLEPP